MSAALSSYDAGQALTPVLLLAGGLALVISGTRRRRSAAATDRGTRYRARSQVAFGVLLLLMATVGTAGARIEAARSEAAVTAALGPPVTRTITLPAAVLGLQRDTALSAKATAALAASRTAGAVAIYSDHGQPTLTVAAVTGAFDDPAAALEQARQGLAGSQGLALETGRDVHPGRLGGTARCWPATHRGTPLQLCLLADRGSVLSVLDATATSTADAARRARAVREAAVR